MKTEHPIIIAVVFGFLAFVTLRWALMDPVGTGVMWILPLGCAIESLSAIGQIGGDENRP